jgi:uncharacterized protein
MDTLAFWQQVIIFIIFIWSGFVRSGLGFGGAVLSLPFLLIVTNQPLVFLPIIAVHLLVFSSLTIVQPWLLGRLKGQSSKATTHVQWPYLGKILAITLIPKLIGVLGVLSLPTDLITGFIFFVVLAYGIGYLLQRQLISSHPVVDWLLLIIGGYVSGTSLIGAPLIIAVMARQLKREHLRDTLFALWFVLVSIKLIAFAAAGVDLQWDAHLLLLPAAAIGHLLGLQFHQYSLKVDPKRFMQWIGGALIVVALVGLIRL